MKLIKDYIYKFDGLWEKSGECRIRIYKEGHSSTVFICSELATNQGGSITTIVEALANDVWRLEGKPDPFIWIEHYPANLLPKGEETFDRVSFTQTPEGRFFTPSWESMNRNDVEKLVDQPV